MTKGSFETLVTDAAGPEGRLLRFVIGIFKRGNVATRGLWVASKRGVVGGKRGHQIQKRTPERIPIRALFECFQGLDHCACFRHFLEEMLKQALFPL